MPNKEFFIPLFLCSDGFLIASDLKNAPSIRDSKTAVH